MDVSSVWLTISPYKTCIINGRRNIWFIVVSFLLTVTDKILFAFLYTSVKILPFDQVLI